MTGSTARLLRRYRDRVLPDWRIQKALEQEFNRAIAEHSALAPEIDELRRAAPDRLESFDAASDLALQRLGERRFDLAWQEIRKARQEVSELRRCAAVAVTLREVGTALEEVEALLSPAFAAQPTVRILHRLKELARSLLDQGETRKAAFVVLLLSNRISLLSARRRGEPTAGFERRLADLEARGSGAVSHLRTLSKEGYHELAERLSDDLEVELSISDRARRASQGSAFGGLETASASVQRQAREVQASLVRWLESNL